MTDYISRADAMAYIERVINSGLGRNKSLDYIHKYISALPSAVPNCQKCAIKELWQKTEKEDLVSVVRCKDCIYYETCNLSSSHWWKGGYTVDIEFCSFGERREP